MKKQTKYSILVIIIAALVLEIATAEQFIATRRAFSEQLLEKAHRDLNGSPHITQLKQEVDEALAVALPQVEANIDKPELLSRQMSDFCRNLHSCVGFAVAFVPGKAPQAYVAQGKNPDGQFSIFYYKKDKNIIKADLSQIDYTQRQWYTQIVNSPDSIQNGLWSEPYVGTLNDMLMSSYSMAVKDRKGDVVAVLCVDVPLRELSQMAEQLYDNQKKSLLRGIAFHILGLVLLAFIIFRSVRSIRRLQEVSVEKERIASELSVARNIQHAMLPETFPGPPDRDDLSLFALIEPAREVGGDFYDFIIRKDKLFFCIGDVSGKGVPAALLMSVARSHFRTETGRNDNPTGIVTAMNQMLCNEQTSGYFATIFVGMLDLATGRLDYCNAGHEAPILKERDGGRIIELDVVPNLPIGSLADWNYVGQSTELKPYTLIFLYTDGLSEASNSNGTLFSRERIVELIRNEESVDPKSVIGNMAETVRKYEEGCVRFDDVTMLAFYWSATITPQQNNLTPKPMDRNLDLCFAAKLDELLRLKSFVSRLSEQFNIDEERSMQIRLVLEEAVSNVINYSEADSIDIHAATDGQGMLVIRLRDNGKPFDPVAAPGADYDTPMVDRPLGGWGIELMRQMSDGLEYERDNEYNILTIKKNIR